MSPTCRDFDPTLAQGTQHGVHFLSGQHEVAGDRGVDRFGRPLAGRHLHTAVVDHTYTGQAGPVYIEPRNNPGAFDREVFLVMKEFAPAFSRGGDMAMDVLAGDPLTALQQTGKAADEEAQEKTKGFEVAYELFGINGRMLGHGEPIRVTGAVPCAQCLALTGHVFRVVALDGNPVPAQADVPVLWLDTAERISAIVEMNHPGVWVLGDLGDDDRSHGMGIVVEYAGQKGEPRWTKPKPFRWDYTRFGTANPVPASPDETIEMTIVKDNAALNGFNQWTFKHHETDIHPT